LLLKKCTVSKLCQNDEEQMKLALGNTIVGDGWIE
jgi:hypothetical protein